MTPIPKLSVLVLNYNGLKWLSTCLSSIAKTDYPNFDVYMVDNGSVDGSIDYVQKNFPRVNIISNKRNLGFAEGFNRAIKEINDEYIVLLNNDVEVLSKNWIRHLVNMALNDPKTAAVACKLISMENKSRLDSVGGMGIPYWRGFVDMGRGEVDKGQYDRIDFEPFSICGAGVLINRDIFTRLGGFDGKFFQYLEDVDLAWRIRLYGYRIAFASKAKVAHYFSGSTKTRALSPKKLYLCYRNLLMMILKNCGSSLGWALRNYFLFSIIITAGFSILEPKKAISVAKAILWNIINFKKNYIWRLRIQSERKVDEREILTKMYPRIKRYRSGERAKLSRILDFLFEYRLSRYFKERYG